MQTITIHGRQPLHGSIRPAAAKTAPCRCWRRHCSAAGRAVCAACPPWPMWTPAWPFCRLWGPTRSAAARISAPAPPMLSAARFRLPGRGHAQLGVLFGAAALPGGVCAAAPAGRLPPGARPVDIHLAGLASMGAEVELEGIAVTLRRKGPLHGVDFTLRLPSVGATMTLLMAACCAQGRTVLRGAAREPEIGDMIAFLCACGADISGYGTSILTVQGGRSLGGAVHARCPTALPPPPMPPRWRPRAETYALPAVTQPCTAHFSIFGANRRADRERTGMGRTGPRPCRAAAGRVQLCADAWPAFATDTAPLAAAVLLAAEGKSEIFDRLFPNRFACAAGFAAMGAEVTAKGRRLMIAGGSRLRGAAVTAPDLRGGAALLVAALGADGTTPLRDPGHIRRGYADLPGEIRRLGAEIG